MYYSRFILYISIILLLKVSTLIFISFFPFIQACFVVLFEPLQVDSICAILGLGDLRAGSLPTSSTSSTSSSSLCSLSSSFFPSSGSLSRHVLSSSFSHHLDHCLDMYYSRFILYISIIFSFESFNLGIHIIRSNHSGASHFLIRTTTSGWCPCHSWSWRLTGWQFTNVIHIIHVVVFIVFIVFMFFFIIWIIVLSMVI